MLHVAVLGLGNWGTALAHHLASKGLPVTGWSLAPRIVGSINQAHSNPSYLQDIKLHPGLRATDKLADTFTADFLILAFPSSALDQLLPKIKPKPTCVIVSAIKGMEIDNLLTPLQFARRRLPHETALAVLSGPSFARDVVAQRPCGVVAASEHEDVARKVAELFSSECMRVYISTDPLGVELGGIVKNIIAIAAGVSDGLGLGDSARAGLITRGLAEMVRFAEALGAEKLTLFGLSGLGDLAMTASSELSRNRTVGLRLGQGENIADIVDSLGSVAEGVITTPLILELARQHNVEMPITLHVAKLLRGEIKPAAMVKALISRPIKREFGAYYTGSQKFCRKSDKT